MKSVKIFPAQSLTGTVSIPGDKSISHRALILGALADGLQEVQGFLPGGDCQATIEVLQALGIQIDQLQEDHLVIHGQGLHGFQSPTQPLNCQRSGTTMRLMAGLLSTQNFSATLNGDPQLRKRPMQRILTPLQKMGAHITAQQGKAPLSIQPSSLTPITYQLPVASAQVKSCLLLAGLSIHGTTTIIEPAPTRDHTERMLTAMGANLSIEDNHISISSTPSLTPLQIHIPSLPHSTLTFPRIGINPTRTGLLDVLKRMGAQLKETHLDSHHGEPLAQLTASATPLSATQVTGAEVVRMIDEFPIFAVAASQAQGITRVTQAQELKHKETDRITLVAEELNKLGALITPHSDGFEIIGRTPLTGATVNSHGDHRIAMSLIIAALLAQSPSIVEDVECIADSFPTFLQVLDQLGVSYEFLN
jgi:3-phosphoshikimate 1-carboxyvinyltransferase